MNTDYFYLLMLCFASGFTQCFLIGTSIFLFRKHKSYQFQRAFAIVMLMLSVGFFNNFVVSACHNLPISAYINILLILYDYMIVGGYMIFVVTLVFPGRFSFSKLWLFEIPYLLAILIFAITQSPIVYPVVQIITVVISSVLFVWLGLSIKRHDAMLRDNVGNIEFLDLRWGIILIALLYVVQLIWSVESLSQQDWFSDKSVEDNLIFDTVWCVITIVYVLLILHKITHQQVFVAPAQEESANEDGNKTAESTNEYYKILNDTNVDDIIRDKKHYLDTALTLQKLATLLGTNRQYLSNYINREKQKTFYEYINDFRLEKAKNLLDKWNDDRQHSMEDLAALSGFNSYSTFLRSFVKKYGKSPSKYLKSKE